MAANRQWLHGTGKERDKGGDYMSKPYRICPNCGCNLDPGEKCDCKDSMGREPAQRTEQVHRHGREHDRAGGNIYRPPLR